MKNKYITYRDFSAYKLKIQKELLCANCIHLNKIQSLRTTASGDRRQYNYENFLRRRTSPPVWYRILTHLAKYSNLKDNSSLTAPYEISQEGIANSIGISRAHASLVLTELKRDSLVIEKLMHIATAQRRKKVYFLSYVGSITLEKSNCKLKQNFRR